MRKVSLLMLAASGALLLAACQPTTPASDHSSAKTSASSRSKQKEDASQTSSSQDVSDLSPKDALAAINTQLTQDLAGELYLLKTPPKNGYWQVSSTASGDQTILQYTPSDTSQDLQKTATAQWQYQLTWRDYTSSDTAAAAVNAEPVQSGLSTVKLGQGVTATQTGGPTAHYLHWADNKWVLTVQDSSTHDDAQPLAEKVVSQLAKTALPLPSDKGAVTLVTPATDDSGQQVIWNDGDRLYTFTGQDALSTLRWAASLSKTQGTAATSSDDSQ